VSHATIPEPSEAGLRWFGLLVLLFFGLLAAVARWQFDAEIVSRCLAAAGVAFALVYYALRPLRRTLYSAWMAAVMPIGWLVSHLVLGAIFYGLITPIGAATRLLGRDRLERRFDASADSYWVERTPVRDPSQYLRQS
jgi:hypothetical protein